MKRPPDTRFSPCSLRINFIYLNSDLEAVPIWIAGIVMTITLKQIAKLAGVSLSTASRVVNGLPGVRPVTRERVLQIIHEYGYQPDPMACSLAARRSRRESCLFPQPIIEDSIIERRNNQKNSQQSLS
jgi:transcriptional regulator with XRE-family HTH domain